MPGADADADAVTPVSAPPANSPPPMAAEENMPPLNTPSPPPNCSSNSDLAGCVAGCGGDADATVDGEDEEADAGTLAGVADAGGSSLKPGGAGAAEAAEEGGNSAPPAPRPPLLKNGLENMEEAGSVEPVDVLRVTIS